MKRGALLWPRFLEGSARMPEKIIAVATIRRLWRDNTKTVAESAAIVGLSRVNFQRRAKALGEPSRRIGRFKPAITDLVTFKAMWNARLSVTDMAKHFGVCQITIYKTAKAHGFPQRRYMKKPICSLAELPQVLAGEAMKKFAVNESAKARGRGWAA